MGCVRVQPHTALGVYGLTVYVIVGRTVCHAMDGPSHAFANPVNVDIRRDFPRVSYLIGLAKYGPMTGLRAAMGRIIYSFEEVNCTSSMGTSGNASGPSAA